MKLTIQRVCFLLLFSAQVYGQNFSLKFDGTDDYVLFPGSEALTTGSFTIEGWFKCQVGINPQVIMMAFRNIPDRNANVTVEVRENGLLRFNFRSIATDLGGDDLFSNTFVADNIWHHFAVVQEGNDRLWLYIDGFPEVVQCGNFAPINLTPIFELGRNRYESNVNFRSFKGNLDDIKIWQRAKNCREIFNDFKSESTGLEAGLFSNYKFDIDLDTVYDCSLFKRHGKRFGVGGLNNLPQYSTDIPSLTDKMCAHQLVSTEEGLKTPDPASWIKISPNPVSNILRLEFTSERAALAQIYTMEGRLMLKSILNGKVNEIDTSSLPAGTYVLKCTEEKAFISTSFIKI